MEQTQQSHRSAHSRSAAEALQDLDRGLRDGTAVEVRSAATGFHVLDEMLGGGLHAGELLLLGGPPGVGKTICALQWARNLASRGTRAVFLCYEHDPSTLLARLLALEAGEAGGDAAISRAIERALTTAEAQGTGLEDILSTTPNGLEALARVRGYADDLVFVRASGAHTTLDAIRDFALPQVPGDRAGVLFVDYLQKIPLQPEPDTEAEKVTRTVEGLKDLALELQIPVVLLSAVDAEGMRANRIRMYHLRGSSAVAFESDVVIMLNDKQKAISKIHLSYDPVGAREFRNWVVMSIEKNRGGPTLIDLEFRKDFSNFRFDPEGGIVKEKLVDERLDESMH